MTEINPRTDAEKLIGGFITSQNYYTVKQKRRGERWPPAAFTGGFKVFFFTYFPLCFEPHDYPKNSEQT